MPARPTSGVAGVVLAAGESRRFGSPKQLATLGGRTLLEHALEALTRAGSVTHRFVVVGAHRDQILAAIELGGIEPIVCDRWREGQSAALRAGVEAARSAGAAATVVLLGDQPLVSHEAVDRVVEAHLNDPGRDAVRARYGSVAAHPVLISTTLYDSVLKLRGDAGARDLLAASDVLEVDCDGLGKPDDVDTPEDLRELKTPVRGGVRR